MIRCIVSMYAESAQKAAQFLVRWLPHQEFCRAQDGCLQYEVYRSVTNPARIVLLELWRDLETYDRHWAEESALEMDWSDINTEGVEFDWDRKLYELVDNQWRAIKP